MRRLRHRQSSSTLSVLQQGLQERETIQLDDPSLARAADWSLIYKLGAH